MSLKKTGNILSLMAKAICSKEVLLPYVSRLIFWMARLDLVVLRYNVLNGILVIISYKIHFKLPSTMKSIEVGAAGC